MSAFLNLAKILPKENRAEPVGFQIYPKVLWESYLNDLAAVRIILKSPFVGTTSLAKKARNYPILPQHCLHLLCT